MVTRLPPESMSVPVKILSVALFLRADSLITSLVANNDRI